MKLSMWIIANQLSDFDLEVSINHRASMMLRSARRAYATDCVHVFPEGSDAVCEDGSNSIRIKNISAELAFELLQSIFDFFDEWQIALIEAAQRFDFDAVINLCERAFRNPTVILSNNFHVVAMSKHYEGIDSEWDHLCRYGYSSPAVVQGLHANATHSKMTTQHDAQYFVFSEDQKQKNCSSVQIFGEKDFCGRINVLEGGRKLNTGDLQLLNVIAHHIGSFLEKYNELHQAESSLLRDFILGQSCFSDVEEGLRRFAESMRWEEGDPFRVVVLEIGRVPSSVKMLMRSQMKNLFPLSSPLLHENFVITVVNQRLYPFVECQKKIAEVATEKNIYLMMSLEFTELSQAPWYYDQAIQAIGYAQLYRTPHKTDFYEYAIRYLIERSDECLVLHACHPLVRHLFMQNEKQAQEKLRVLKAYLDNDCSPLRAACALYLHKNTLVYRLKKIMDPSGYDLNDLYTREYMRLSLQIVDLFHQKRLHQ